MTTPPSAASAPAPETEATSLPRHYGVAGGVLVLALGCLALLPLWGGALWLSLGVGLLGLFLLLQTALLRLEFQADSLVVWRQNTELRRFPYASWLAWKLYWPGLPVVFYFREERSIHLLPLLFDAGALRRQLDRHLSHLSASDA
ncbi:DUF3119 family protein [Cyanobium sp. NS01]|uniref:DUF3119 family protein n=1 Tax=Cyanobium sp. NS01 TaxID=261284 RepID=UPI001647F094|nr:DUF3119 family protein [Cyanobium sp. NS01]QNI71462.1 hypothetical protein CyaNS01_02344 [Cyanobium sp. NS01]